MTDPLDAAMKAANPNKLASATSTKASSAVDSAKDKVTSKLPKVKDPDLVKKQAEAEAQKKLSDTKLKALEAKNKAVDMAKGAALGAAKGAAGALIGKLKGKLPKLPAPPSVGLALALAKKIKETEKERRKTTKENVTKSVEAFTFPIKLKTPKLEPPKPPVIKDIPLLNKPIP